MRYLVENLPRIPVDCIFEITNACNLRCIHCESCAGRVGSSELSTDEALAVCDELIALGTEKVHLSGGEPLIRSDWAKIAERLSSSGASVNLITNGLLLDPETVRRARDSGVNVVAVSLDGLADVHDAIRLYPEGAGGPSRFRRAVEAAAACLAAGLRTMIVTHINGWNLLELDEMHDLLAALPIDAWQLQLGMPAGRMRRAPDGYCLTPAQLPSAAAFIARKQRRPFPIITADNIGYFAACEPNLRPLDDKHFPFFTGCMAGIRGISIGPDGTVKGCPSMGAGFAEGNVRDRSLRAIWEDPNAFAYNRKWDAESLQGFCRECEFRHLCRAGCTSFAAATGSIYDNEYCLYRLTRRGAPNAREIACP